jgi:hypothetical protein
MQESPLTDGVSFVRKLEEAYGWMWKRQQEDPNAHRLCFSPRAR